MKQKIKFIIFLIMAAYFGYRGHKIYFYMPEIDFENLKFKTLDGKALSLYNNYSSSAIIIFFQTWCSPCIAEMKLIQKQYNDFRFTQLYFISDEDTDKISALKQKFHLDSLNFIHSERLLTDIGIEAFPSIYIIKNGQEIESHKGTFIDETNFEDEIFHLKEMLK